MKDLCDALKGNFTIVNLGCIGDLDYTLPKNIVQTMTVVEVDAEGGAETQAQYHRKITVQKPISGNPGKRTFRRNSFAGTCSLLDPMDGMVAIYGFERYCQEIERVEVECETLPMLLQREKVPGIDFLKTDLEGLDTEIIRSCKDYLGKIHFIQCELRFKPFYQTEPYFHEAVTLLADHGYEVLDILHIDRWKYKTPHWTHQLQGRAEWADWLFCLRPDVLKSRFGSSLPEALAKEIILACALGKRNYGEFLLQQFDASIPAEWKTLLQQLVKPAFPGCKQFMRSLRKLCMPIELLLKHRIHRSEHVAIR